MRKIVYIFLICLLLPMNAYATIGSNSSIKDVNVYIFKNECDKCIQEEKWLDSIYTKYARLNIVKVNDIKKYEDILKKLKVPNNKYPLLIIGSDYFIGFNDKIKEEVENAIEAYSKEDSYCDIFDTKLSNKECLDLNKKIYTKPKSIMVPVIAISTLGIISILFKLILEYRKNKNKLG